MGGTIVASRPWYGYGGYDYGSGYYGYNPGYSASNYSSIDYGSGYYGNNPGYGYDQGYTLGGALVPIQLCRGPEGW